MAKPTHENNVVPLRTPAPRWQSQGPDIFLRARAAIDGVDALATAMETKWGIGRLRLLVDVDLRERFDRQRLLFGQAVLKGAPEDVERESERMAKAWRKLDQVASEAGASPLSPEVWETYNPKTGDVILICRTNVDEIHLARAGRKGIIYSLQDIGNILATYAEQIADIKSAFPGATVHQLGKQRADSVALQLGDYIPGDWEDDEIPF